MPELALHFSVVFALAAPRLGIGRALLLSLLALTPDLDALMLVHRSVSHSLIILALAYTPLLLITHRYRPRHLWLAALGLLALMSHPTMDLFQTYTPILYPALHTSLWVAVDGGVRIFPGGLVPQVSVEVRRVPTDFRPFDVMDAPVFTSEGFAISLLLVAVPLLVGLKKARLRLVVAQAHVAPCPSWGL